MSTLEKLRAIVVERLMIDSDNVTLEADFIYDLNADSFDLADLIFTIEQEWHITILDDDFLKIRTVGDAVAIIDRLAT